MSETKQHKGWNSRWTFIMAATGSAVGLGNIWKFPYIAGENGGGAFVLVYLLCIAIIGLPILMTEIVLGRAGRANPVDSMIKHARASDVSKLWGFIGWMGTVAGLIIMSFSSVVVGWVLDYIFESAQSTFVGKNAAEIAAYFETTLQGNKNLQLAWHTTFTLLTVAVIAGGVNKGLGTAVRVLMPLLFVLLLVLLAYSYQYGDFSAGANFLFNVDFSKLTSGAILVAMGHAFFTLSLGMGAIMVYGSYMPEDASIPRTAATVAFLDTLIAIVAGMAIFPLVFANGLEPDSGPGLMFVSLPIVFGSMPGGTFFGCLFFILVGIAAWSSSISLIEPAASWLCENTGLKRPAVAAILGAIVWSGGFACIFVGGVFASLDYIATNILLPLGGLAMAIFATWVMKRKIAKNQMQGLTFNQFNLWYAVTRVFAPIGIITIFLNQIGVFAWLAAL